MDVLWLVAIQAVEEQSVWAGNTSNCWHSKKNLRCRNVAINSGSIVRDIKRLSQVSPGGAYRSELEPRKRFAVGRLLASFALAAGLWVDILRPISQTPLVPTLCVLSYPLVMTSTDSLPQIGPALRDDLPQALGLIFSHSDRGGSVPRSDTLLSDTDSEKMGPDGVLVARRATRIVGAVFCQVQVGKTAVIWPPRIVAGEPEEVAGQLLEAALGSLDERYLRVVHALSDGRSNKDDALLRSVGFEPLAELIYLVSGEIDFPSRRPSGPLEFEPYRQANHDRFTELVEATYRETLDCPALNGIRDIEDTLAGYRASGGDRGELWLIIRHENRDIGCLLLGDHPDHGNCELVYMGLVVEARGRGWGTHVTRHAQWLTRQTGRSRLVLAVDEANWPARKMYASVGFHDWDRRSVYQKLFDTPV